LSVQSLPPLVLKLSREPGLDLLKIEFPDGNSDEIEFTEAPEWFRLRHATPMNLDVVEKAIDECWNWYEATLVIKHPRNIVKPFVPADPQI
jgi:hypothetical protein